MTPHEIARSYLGTPWRHQARKKDVGVDCVGLVVCVAREIGIVAPDWDVKGYSRIPDGKMLVHHLDERLTRIDRADLRPGDVVCVIFDKHPQHVGIVGDYTHGGLSLIHSDSKRGKVLETRLVFSDAMRFAGAYRFPELE